MRDDLALIEYRHSLAAARMWGGVFLAALTALIVGVVEANEAFHEQLSVKALAWLLFTLAQLANGVFAGSMRQTAISRINKLTGIYINAGRVPPWV